jgi:hypothetical protein
MSIDTSVESILTLAQAARLVPRRRKKRPCNICTLWRWVHLGIKGIHLESVVIGGTTCTSKEALQRFYANLTDQAEAQRTPSKKPTPRRRSVECAKRIAAARKRLQKSGI